MIRPRHFDHGLWTVHLRQIRLVNSASAAFCCVVTLTGLLVTFPNQSAVAADTTASAHSVKIHMLRRKECDKCERAHGFLTKVAATDRWLNVRTLDVEASNIARDIYAKLLKLFNVPAMEFPVTIIGTHAVTGYVSDRTTGVEILGHAQLCRWIACEDMIDALGQDEETILEVKIRVPTLSCSGLKIAMSDHGSCVASQE